MTSLAAELPTDHQQLQDAAVAFARQALGRDMVARDRAERFSREDWQKCAEFGVQGMPIAQEYGGMGLGILPLIAVMEGLGYACRDSGCFQMVRIARQAVKSLLNRYLRWICRREFESQAFKRFNERPIEFGVVFRKLGEVYPRTVLDVGSGTTALPHLMRNCGCLVTATDNVRDYWPSGMLNRHYHVIDDNICDTRLSARFDLVTCVSVLEHIQDPDSAVRNMFRLLKPGGHLVLTCPYTERSYVPNVYELPNSSYGRGAPYITQSYSRLELARWLRENGGVVLDQEYWQFWEGDHWTVGNQIIPPKKVTANDAHQLTCLHIQKECQNAS